MTPVSSIVSSSTQRPSRLRDVSVPGWRRWAPQAVVVWALSYGSLRVYWALGHPPSPPPIGTDLIGFTGWWPVALCVAAAVAAVALRGAAWSRPLAVAAWSAVAGCLVRLLAQLAVGFGSELTEGDGTVLLFEAGFLLAGTVLPLALVCRWGRVFPPWVPVLAGRGVPRWLVLGPGLVLGVGMTAYFGVTLVKMSLETLSGGSESFAGSEPLWFFWTAVPAYLVWGLGLLVAALAYRDATRPPCRFCQVEAWVHAHRR
jgi:hypothetical protein